MKVTHSLCVKEDLTWEVCAFDHKVDSISTPLSSIPRQLAVDSLQTLLTLVEETIICPGNPDAHFIDMMLSRKEHKILHDDGSVAAYIDDNFDVDGRSNSRTVRTSLCTIMVHNGVCPSCHSYRSTLRALHSRWSHKRSIPAKHTNNRYLRTPEKENKLKTLMLRAKMAETEVKHLKERINSSTLQHGVQVDQDFHDDLTSIMKSSNQTMLQDFPPG
jgi:hypothetical protein